MEYVYLGQTGVRVSRLCFGTMTFGEQADRKVSEALFETALAKGINFFDCANIYSHGESERILGELIQGMRNDLIITSKVFYPVSDKINDQGSSRRHIRLALHDSLRRLKTDYLDIYFLHGYDVNTPLSETLSAMDELVRQGKILYYGISNFAAWQIEKALGLAERHGWHKPAVIQPMYNLVKRQAEVEIFPLAREEKLGVIAYSPLGAGLLTGKYLSGAKTVTGRLLESDRYKKRYDVPGYMETARKFVEFAKAHAYHPASLAVAWVMANPVVTAPIIGARSVEQLVPSLEATEIKLTPELYRELNALSVTPPPATDRSEELPS
jgi:aryl-alcohol dehydrogenase-like predicted oxidoreductase